MVTIFIVKYHTSATYSICCNCKNHKPLI